MDTLLFWLPRAGIVVLVVGALYFGFIQPKLPTRKNLGAAVSKADEHLRRAEWAVTDLEYETNVRKEVYEFLYEEIQKTFSPKAKLFEGQLYPITMEELLKQKSVYEAILRKVTHAEREVSKAEKAVAHATSRLKMYNARRLRSRNHAAV